MEWKEEKDRKVYQIEKSDRQIIGFAIFISILLFFIRFSITDIDFYHGSPVSAALFLSIIVVMLYFFFTSRQDYFIITWLSFHFGVEMIKIPGLSTSILGIANVIFIPLMLLKIINFKNRHFITALLLIMIGLTNLGSDSLRLIVSRIFEFISIIVFMGYVIKEVKKPQLIIRSVFIIGLLSVPTAIYQAILHPANGVLVDWRGARVFGVLFWHNMYSMYLIAPTMVAYYYIRQVYSLPRVLTFILLVIANIFTLSRQGLLVLFISILIFEFFYHTKKNMQAKRVAITIFLVVVIILYAIWQQTASERLRADSISERTNIWNTILPLLEGKMLTGNGLGSYVRYSDLVADGLAPHNQYLLVLFEIGLLGLVCLIIFLVLTLLELYKQTHQSKNGSDAALGFSITCALIIIAMVGNGFSELSALNGWIAAACAILLGRMAHKERKEKEENPEIKTPLKKGYFYSGKTTIKDSIIQDKKKTAIKE